MSSQFEAIDPSRRETAMAERNPAEKAAETAQQTTRNATEKAKQTAERGAETTRRATEAASQSYEEMLSVGRENLEGMARASQAALNGTSELGSVWLSFWNEQLTDGMDAMRSLAECRTWQEALTVQNEFARTSLQRVFSRAAKSAEVTSEMVSGSFKPLQECAHKTVERFPRAAA
jgi:hypothetical protein